MSVVPFKTMFPGPDLQLPWEQLFCIGYVDSFCHIFSGTESPQSLPL